MVRSGVRLALLLATDDVVRLRVVDSRWNECDKCGPLGHVFFNMLTLQRHKELWHYDTDGNRVSTSVRRRIPIMEGIRTAVPRPLHANYFGEVHLLHTNGIWDLPRKSMTSPPCARLCGLGYLWCEGQVTCVKRH